MRASWGRLLKVIRSYSGTINDKGKIHSPPPVASTYIDQNYEARTPKEKIVCLFRFSTI